MQAFPGHSLILMRPLRPIIFYSGTIPLLTFAQTTLQIAFLEFPEYISSTFVCGISIFGALAWVVQASIWASCELSGGLPNKSSKTGTPSFCPQAVFVNHGGNLSAGLTAFKNAMAWIMMVAYLAMAFITFLGMRRTQMGRRRDEFHELVELPKDPTFAPGPRYRPYSSTFQRTEPEKVPAIKILSVSTRP